MATKTAARTAKKSKKASKKLPVCTSKDLRKPKGKRRKCTVPPKKTTTSKTVTTSRPSPAGAVAAPPATSAAPGSFPTPPLARGAEEIVVTAPVDSPTPTGAGPQAGPGEVEGTGPEEAAEPAREGAPRADEGNDQKRGSTSDATTAALPVYAGTFGPAQAFRLLFRAGCGPSPGQAETFASLGVRGAVSRLLNPGSPQLVGPSPTGSYLVGGALAPRDKWGHLHLDCLDRMVRSTDSLTERMTLILHDWFGISTSGVITPIMADHIEQMRRVWRQSFRQTLKDVTASPAMLTFLNGASNFKGAPNENYSREFLELYALGADRGAYTETDVRELARAFTGFTGDWATNGALTNVRMDEFRRDSGSKRLFAGTPSERSGDLRWTDAIDAVVNHPMHATFVVLKLWAHFVPTAPSAATVEALCAIYRANGERLAPVLEAILLHPDLYDGPSMVKPPMVFIAGLMRATGVGITTDNWVTLSSKAGQQVGYPPTVAGWNENAWLSTGTYSARWACVSSILATRHATVSEYTSKTAETPTQALSAALAIWANPPVASGHLALLTDLSAVTWDKTPPDVYGWLPSFLASRQNVLRQLVASAPDFQVS